MLLTGEQLDTDLNLILPIDTSLRIRNQDGDIDIHGIEGSIDVTAGEGMTRIMDITGSVSVTSSDGDIYLRAHQGGVSDESASIDSLSENDPDLNQNSVYRVHSSEGDIDLEGLKGDVEVTAGDGELRCLIFRVVCPHPLRMETFGFAFWMLPQQKALHSRVRTEALTSLCPPFLPSLSLLEPLMGM